MQLLAEERCENIVGVMSVSGPSQSESIVYTTQLAQDEIYLDGEAERAEETADLYIDTGTPILPEDISTFYSLNFPNLSAVSATDCNIQSFTTISSGIAPEAELAVVEDKGVNTSTRDLVLAAISVMKGRKARPDTKRICNWVNRKYGRSVQEVVQEIDDLCQQAILEKVDYKGSISFRITSEKKLHKRVGRRKNTASAVGAGNGGGGSADQQQQSQQQQNGGGGVGGAVAATTPQSKTPRATGPRKSPKGGGVNRNKDGGAGGGGVEKMDPVTLNLILREELKLVPDDVVTKESIINAVEMTERPINKRAVYRDLETILAHEIHLGYLVKNQDGCTYLLASINKHKHYRGTIPLKSSKRKPKPTQKILEMEAGMKNKTANSGGGGSSNAEKYSEYVTFDQEGNLAGSGNNNGGGGAGAGAGNTPGQVPQGESRGSDASDTPPGIKSEDEWKDELIKETLINNSLMKMKSKPKSGKGKHKKDPPARGTSVQGPILSVPTPYSSMSSMTPVTPPEPPSPIPTTFNNTAPASVLSSAGHGPAFMQPMNFPPGLTSQPLPYSSLTHALPPKQQQPPPSPHPHLATSLPQLPVTAPFPPQQQTLPQTVATSPSITSGHPPPQPISSPKVEILPVVGAAVTHSHPKKATARMPIDELSLTTVHKEERKTGIVPIKPKVKKEAWQVSITVKEAKPKVPRVDPTEQHQNLAVPNVPVTLPSIIDYSTKSNNSHNDTATDLSMSKEGKQEFRPHSIHQSSALTAVNQTDHQHKKPESHELPIARKTKVPEETALDYSSKEKKVGITRNNIVSKSLGEGDNGMVVVDAKEEKPTALPGSRASTRMERKRSMEKEAEIQREMETRKTTSLGGKKTKVEDDSSDQSYEPIEEEKFVTKKRSSRSLTRQEESTQEESKKPLKRYSLENPQQPKADLNSTKKNAKIQQQNTRAPTPTSILNNKKKSANTLSTKPAGGANPNAAAANIEPVLRSRRLAQRQNSFSPEPEDEGEGEDEGGGGEEPEPEAPQFETRTSSGRRKRARKIFDPADHDVPSRIIKKCRTVSPIPPPPGRVGGVAASSRSSRSGSTDQLPETNGLKELMQPVEDLSHTAAMEDELENSPPTTPSASPQPPPFTGRTASPTSAVGSRTTRRGGGSLTPTQQLQIDQSAVVKNSREDQQSKVKKGGNNQPAAVINGTRRRSRDQQLNATTENGSKSTKASRHEKDSGNNSPAAARVKSPLGAEYDQSDGLEDLPLSTTKSINNKKQIVKEDSQFKVPQRPATKASSPNSGGSKSKKSKVKPTLGSNGTIGKHPSKGKLVKSPKSSQRSSSSPSKQGQGEAGTGGSAPVKSTKEVLQCSKCDTGHKKGDKLISCKDCGKTIHPKCLNYPEELTDRIYMQPWQCIDCKLCSVCNQPGNDDKLLFCDSCDQAYHMSCHRPAILRTPRGRWECDTCAAHTGYKGEDEDKFIPPGAETFFEELLPAMPPGASPWPYLDARISPAAEDYPRNWQDLPVDPSIPDIASWSAARMSQYLVQNGIKDTVAKVFFDQEIDGASALVLTRKDVLHSLGLKLGPALKVYQHIKRLQTRRNFYGPPSAVGGSTEIASTAAELQQHHKLLQPVQ